MSLTSQWWLRPFNNAALSTSAANFISVTGGGSLAGNATENIVQAPIASAGTLRTLVVTLATPPGGSASYQFQVSLNGTPSTILSGTITGTGTTLTVTGAVAVNAGDLVTVKCTPSSTPSATAGQISLEFDPTTANSYCYPANNVGNVSSVSGIIFSAGLLSTGTPITGTDSIATGTRSLVPFAGTLTAVFMALSVAPGAGASWDLIICQNGAEIAATAINVANTNKTGSVTGLNVAVAAGDVLTFKEKAANTSPATTRFSWGMAITPTNPGLFALANGHSRTGFTAQRYLGQVGGDASDSATEATVQYTTAPAGLSLTGMYVALNGAPIGGGNGWTLVQRKNTANGNLTFTITGAATAGNDTGHFDNVATGDIIDISQAVIGSPTTTGGQAWAVAATTNVVAPPGGTGRGGGNPPLPPPAGSSGRGGRNQIFVAHMPGLFGRYGSPPMVQW